MKRLLFAALAFVTVTLFAPETTEAQRNCVRGKPCGNTCIARNLTCRTATPARPTPARQPAASAPSSAIRTPPDGTLYVASSRGRVYYPISCNAWRSLAEANLRWYVSAEAAETAGLTRTTNQDCGEASPPDTVPTANP